MANNDKDSVVKFELIPPITTRSLRIIPESWYGLISLRVELYGCKAGKNLQYNLKVVCDLISQ